MEPPSKPTPEQQKRMLDNERRAARIRQYRAEEAKAHAKKKEHYTKRYKHVESVRRQQYKEYCLKFDGDAYGPRYKQFLSKQHVDKSTTMPAAPNTQAASSGAHSTAPPTSLAAVTPDRTAVAKPKSTLTNKAPRLTLGADIGAAIISKAPSNNLGTLNCCSIAPFYK